MEMDIKRLKTKSKRYYDDEIIAILPNGDIVLKPGVRRQPKRSFDLEANEEAAQYWNYWVYHRDRVDRIKKNIEEENDWG